MFGKIVLDIDTAKFEHILEQEKQTVGAKLDTDLSADDLQRVAEKFAELVRSETGHDFPTDPHEQLKLAIQAVFRSWNSPRAIAYRDFEKIPHDLGTAVNVQTMVFGNMGSDSGTGVAFTRNPNTGERALYGEYLPNAQGEDVVAGIRTPLAISAMAQNWPSVYEEFKRYADMLERHYRDMQDLEFTVENGKLYMLQTRNGKRSAVAAVKIAVDMVHDASISKEEAVQRVAPAQVEQLLHRQIDPAAQRSELGTKQQSGVCVQAHTDVTAQPRPAARCGRRLVEFMHRCPGARPSGPRAAQREVLQQVESGTQAERGAGDTAELVAQRPVRGPGDDP